jgi:hypothetical protein
MKYTIIHIFGEAGFKEDSSYVLAHLSDEDPELRRIVLHTLAHHWKMNEHEDKLLHALHHDDDELVRREAAIGLGALKRGQANDEIVSVLREVFYNEDEDFDVRTGAYRAILAIKGLAPGKIYRMIRGAKRVEELDSALIGDGAD